MSDEEVAARQALAAFAIQPASVELASRSENITFKVTGAEGAVAYALRLHRPGYNSPAELISERLWTAALAEAGFAVPVGVKTADGADYVLVTLAGGEQRQAGLARWTPGEVLAERLKREGEAAPLADWFARLGEIAAALHRHSAAWRPPPGFTRRVLDADGLMGPAPSWGPFWRHPNLTAGEAALMAATGVKLHAALARLPRDAEHFGMIHADLHHGNLLVDDGRLTVIDFDDAAFGWYLYDLAVALENYLPRPDFADLQAALLDGYRRVRPLGSEAEALLPTFLLVRRLAIIGWLHQRPEIDPGPRLADLKSLAVTLCESWRPAF